MNSVSPQPNQLLHVFTLLYCCALVLALSLAPNNTYYPPDPLEELPIITSDEAVKRLHATGELKNVKIDNILFMEGEHFEKDILFIGVEVTHDIVLNKSIILGNVILINCVCKSLDVSEMDANHLRLAGVSFSGYLDLRHTPDYLGLTLSFIDPPMAILMIQDEERINLVRHLAPSVPIDYQM